MPRPRFVAASCPVSSASSLIARVVSLSASGGLVLILGAGPASADSITAGPLPAPAPTGDVLMPATTVPVGPTVLPPVPVVVMAPRPPSLPAVPTVPTPLAAAAAPLTQPVQPALPAPTRPASTSPAAPLPAPIVGTAPGAGQPLAPVVATPAGGSQPLAPAVGMVPGPSRPVDAPASTAARSAAPRRPAAGAMPTEPGVVTTAPTLPTVAGPASTGLRSDAPQVVMVHIAAQMATSKIVYRSLPASVGAAGRPTPTVAFSPLRIFDRAAWSQLYDDHHFSTALTQLLYAGAAALASIGLLLLAGDRGRRRRWWPGAVTPRRSST